MNRKPRNRVTRRVAEKVLDGESTTLPIVGDLLAAARHRAPGVSELPGEAQALAWFRVAHAPLSTRWGRLRAARAATIAALSTKFAAGAIAAVAAGSVVVAASTGVLPVTGSHTGHHPPPAAPGASASPSPNLRGLCIAYRADIGRTPGEAIKAPAFIALTSAAGTESVADYCSRLLAVNPGASHAITPPTRRPTSLPSQAAAHPSAHATPHPAGRPTTLPPPASPQSSPRPSGPSSPGSNGAGTLHLPRRP